MRATAPGTGARMQVRTARPEEAAEIEGSPPEGELAALFGLFADPEVIGTGLGGVLLRHALEQARLRGFRRLVLDADPGAESFYARRQCR